MTLMPSRSLSSTLQDLADRIRRHLQPGAVILMYHRVAEPRDDPLHLCIPSGEFARQMEYLSREYDPVPLVELLPRLRAGGRNRRLVAVTFDDGYADNLLLAGPILERWRIPATVFVTTGYLDGRREFWWDELPRLVQDSRTDPVRWKIKTDGKDAALEGSRTRDEVLQKLYNIFLTARADERERLLTVIGQQAALRRMVRPAYRPLTALECQALARSGIVQIGAHTTNHLWLAAHSLEQQERELLGSRRELEDILNSPVHSLAYPYGKRESVTSDTLRMARRAGFQSACANVRGRIVADTDPLWLPRFIPGNQSGEVFRVRMKSFFGYRNSPRQPHPVEKNMPNPSVQPVTAPPAPEIPQNRNHPLRKLAGKILRTAGISRSPRKKKKAIRRIPVFTAAFARLRMAFGIPPLSFLSGHDRGTVIHRYYLDRFFEEFSADIRGHCMEFLNDQYASRFGKERVTRVDILHKEGSGKSSHATIVADLLAPHDIPPASFDCIICTHTLHIVEDPLRFLMELKRLLKPQGVLLLGVPNSSTIQPWWHELWRFTPEGMKFLAARVFGEENIVVRSYGNSIAAAGELRGLCAEDFFRAEMDFNDDRFAMEVCLRAVH